MEYSKTLQIDANHFSHNHSSCGNISKEPIFKIVFNGSQFYIMVSENRFNIRFTLGEYIELLFELDNNYFTSFSSFL